MQITQLAGSITESASGVPTWPAILGITSLLVCVYFFFCVWGRTDPAEKIARGEAKAITTSGWDVISCHKSDTGSLTGVHLEITDRIGQSQKRFVLYFPPYHPDFEAIRTYERGNYIRFRLDEERVRREPEEITSHLCI